MTDYTLFIIDVQPGNQGEYGNTCPWYRAVTDRVVENIEREVLKAKADGAAICDVRVDYFGWNDEWFGPTDKRIMRHCTGYERHFSTSKLGSGDGASTVISSCRWKKLSDLKSVKIVGCRTNACVLAFVEGMRRELPDCEIEVIKDCCGELPTKTEDWSAFDKIPNIRVVEGGEVAA